MRKGAQTPQGKRFSELLDERWKNAPQVEFVRRVGVVENPGQQLTHWKNRGVPPEYSLKAAELLRCQPHEISAIKPAMSRGRGAHELLPLHALLLKRIEDFDEAKMAQMFEAAGFIRNGIPLKPDPAHRSNNVITDKKLAESKL